MAVWEVKEITIFVLEVEGTVARFSGRNVFVEAQDYETGCICIGAGYADRNKFSYIGKV